MQYSLKFPIEVDGKQIAAVTIRRPKGRDMAAIGDHFAAFQVYQAANADAIKNAIVIGDGGKAEIDFSKVDPTKIVPPDAKVFQAMIAIAGRLTGLDDAAGDLDAADVQEIATRVANMGEVEGRGKAKIGGGQ